MEEGSERFLPSQVYDRDVDVDNNKRRKRSPTPTHETEKSTSPRQSSHVNGQSNTTMNMKPLSLSILGVEPIDEFIHEVADWIHAMIINRPNVGGEIEVEAKLGVLKYKDGNQRLNHPVRVETILFEDDSRFESNMSTAQHKHFNSLLNKLELSSRQPSHPTSPIKYTHSYLIDTFYPSDDGNKTRVTRDEKTGEVKACVKKIRLGNMDVFSPKRFVDWRLSVNVEVPVSHPIGTAVLTRRKDRLSYEHEEFSIDLTQVTQTGASGSQPQIIHELEVEFARPAVLLSTAALRGDPNASPHERDAFDELVRSFVNNVRILVRNAETP